MTDLHIASNLVKTNFKVQGTTPPHTIDKVKCDVSELNTFIIGALEVPSNVTQSNLFLKDKICFSDMQQN